MSLWTLAVVAMVGLSVPMALGVIHMHSPVSSLVSRPVVRIDSDDTLTRASQVMRSKNVSSVLIGPRHVAIVTERDLTRALAAEYPVDTPVGKVATPLPQTVPGNTEILDAAALMINLEVRHLIVELPDGSDGVVSIRDIMAVLLQAAKPELWLSSLRVKVEIPYPEAWLG
jgi:signal-transduction protein with cAMP-binding, CBS, and nucleotidyltransferase domain